MVDIPTVSIMIASAGVLVAATYYVLQIRHQTKLRQMDLFMRLYSTFMSKESSEALLIIMWLEYRDYNDFVEKYGTPSSERPVWTAYMMVTNFFNEVGMLLHRKFIDIESVDELFAFRVALFWEKLKPLIEGMRKQLNPQVARWFEYLYNELKKRERTLQQRGVENG